MEAMELLFLLPEINAWECTAFQPLRVEIVHVIAKNFNPVNRAEFNPRVESAPCNQLLMPSADNAEQISLKAKD